MSTDTTEKTQDAQTSDAGKNDPVASPNPRLTELSGQGVSIWLDDLSRERLRTGNLQSLIDEKNVVGVTTNPTIFAAAISNADSYDLQLRDLTTRKVSVDEAVRMITTYDVRWACDVLAPVSQATDGQDGRVSIEVDPRLARETEATIAEARALWWLVNRRNLFIKIPATVEGLPAITQAISEGISVNVTLIFSLERYHGVMDAYLTGLEKRAADGGSFDGLESVASFFVSRVDTEYDKRLDGVGSTEATDAKSKAGLANAQLAYEAYEEVFSSDRWKALEAQGAAKQRPLWASTGVKNPDLPDTLYVAELVAPNTVNTMPEKTLDAYADHGALGTPIPDTYRRADAVMRNLAALGVDYDDVVKVLEDEGLQKFEASWEELLGTVKTALEKSA